MAAEETRVAAEWISAGVIGPVREVHVWTDRPLGRWGWPQGINPPEKSKPVPAELDWDMWVGPAKMRPYHPSYLPHVWRGWRDFGTGALGDIGCHEFAPIFFALGLTHPTSVEASSTPVPEESFPHGSMVTYRFPGRAGMPPVTLTWYDGGLTPPRPIELEQGRGMDEQGVLFIGDKGKLLNGRLIPEARMNDFEPPPKTLPRSPGHYQEWIQACKGGPLPGSNFDFAALVTEVVLLGNVALRIPECLLWDGAAMKITNVPEGNALLQSQYRQKWAKWYDANLAS